MKEEVLELYQEGLTVKEIGDQLSLALSTIEVYIYSSGINKDPTVREVHLRMKIRKLISEYEKEFGKNPLLLT